MILMFLICRKGLDVLLHAFTVEGDKLKAAVKVTLSLFVCGFLYFAFHTLFYAFK